MYVCVCVFHLVQELKLDLDAGKNGLEEVTVGVVAVFDGHGGNEASEVASKLLLDYFYMHALFNSYKLMTHYKGILPVTDDEITRLKILKEALLRAIHDIDVKFSQASRT
jgi:serine/threonine protein phosphatase PrpC